MSANKPQNPAQSRGIEDALVTLYGAVTRLGIDKIWGYQELFRQSYFLYKRHIEDPFYALFQREKNLLAGGDVLDIGAGIGYTATVFAQFLSPGFNVHAFEAEENNYLALCISADKRKTRGKIIPVHAAVGSEDGEIALSINKQHRHDHRIATENFQQISGNAITTKKTRLLTIDSYLKTLNSGRPISFIKMDIQGYELPVCLGMQATLDANPKALISAEYAPSEMQELGFSPAESLAFFELRHYQPFLLHKNGTTSATSYPFLVGAKNSLRYVDLLLKPGPNS